jgi:hypothetical protein
MVTYRGAGHIDDFGKVWRGATSSNLVEKAISSRLPFVNRYNTGFGIVGGVLTGIDMGLSFANAAYSQNSGAQVYYSIEGYLKAPSFIPGPLGVAYGISFDYTIRPVWHKGAETYNDAISRGTDPSVIFAMPGLGYFPPIR